MLNNRTVEEKEEEIIIQITMSKHNNEKDCILEPLSKAEENHNVVWFLFFVFFLFLFFPKILCVLQQSTDMCQVDVTPLSTIFLLFHLSSFTN